ncbi:hypothetical protein Cni_G05359 [Canna indica]|uniref:HMA domain-containing protein n=1 Tax=Canna indica TaxID=4628 RepID=A0AAQ3Q5C9_9LILI|nr:hypothetical protein Cni_G05359 [Canna indica]
MGADMSCSHCRERVSRLVSSMNTGLLDYTVDLRKREVTVRGIVETKKRRVQRKHKHTRKRKSPINLGLSRLNCFGA